jgi:hypothetical protein
MIVRSAYAYVRLLFALELLLFTASFLLHVSVFVMGTTESYEKFGIPLFRAVVIVGIPVVAFTKDSLRWIDQIKSCHQWMWKGSLILGIYGILIAILQTIFPQGPSFDDQSLTVSGFPLGFEAISICVLYSVLWRGYLEKAEVVRRVLHSLVIVSLGTIVFLAFRAGYLRHPKR